MVERQPSKLNVASSNLVSRSPKSFTKVKLFCFQLTKLRQRRKMKRAENKKDNHAIGVIAFRMKAFPLEITSVASTLVYES